MNIKNSISTQTALVFLLLFTPISCKNQSTGNEPNDEIISPGENAQTEIQTALIEAEPGDEIILGEGMFHLTVSLTMDNKSDVTLKGSGREKTILSFAGQTSGAEGLLITHSTNIVLQNFRIEDTPGDALKFRNSDGIVMYRIDTVWNGEPSTENGSYGLYPVLSSNILIDDCYAFGASDAGIYVGQADNVIVRNSTAEGNVAGIEIENTTNADVYANTASDNSAGILVFDLPELSQPGSNVRIFNNMIVENGRGNFASGGSIVSEVPAGTGILVMSTEQVEIFGNIVEENNVIGTGIFSINSLIALEILAGESNASFNPATIYVHDNIYSRSNSYPGASDQSFIGNVLVESFGESPIPDVMLDGFFATDDDPSGAICIRENSGNSFVNLNVPNNFPNQFSFDASPHDCHMEPLAGVELEIPNFEDN